MAEVLLGLGSVEVGDVEEPARTEIGAVERLAALTAILRGTCANEHGCGRHVQPGNSSQDR